MLPKTFSGGIHPRDMKQLSQDCAIKTLIPEKELDFFVNQHIGAPAVPLVNVGDRVLVGQKIAQSGGFVSADIFSSVSGSVSAVGPKICANGQSATAISVVSDGLFEKISGYGERRDYTAMSREEIIAAVKDAGIVGMGGAGFPTHVKLTVKDGIKIDYILCNGAECEPYITCDYRLMLEKASAAVTGMKIVMQAFPGARGIFGIENNKPQGIEAVEKAAVGSGVEVLPLLKKYPQGGERMLIKAITGREINSKELPANAGCIVLNFSTLIAICDAVCNNIPLIRRTLTVTGDAVREPSNFDVPIGMSIEEIIDAAGGFVQEPEKVIFGGPMMGMAVYTIALPVTKTTSSILLMTHDAAAEFEPSACIRCGKCLSACPEHLMPIKLKEAAENRDYETFDNLHGLECINCGSCTYVCPAKRRLSQSISSAKGYLLAERKKAAVK